MTSTTSTDAGTFSWLLTNFVRDSHGVRDTVAVSSDGMLIAMSDGLDRVAADRLAAMVSGLVGLSRSAARSYGFEAMKLIMVEMRHGFLLVSAISDGSCLGVIAETGCDIGLVGYEIAVLAERTGELLTPSSIAELRESLRS